MAFISLLIIDFIILVLGYVIFSNSLFGIAGLILLIKNKYDEKKGRQISKIRKVLAAIFCILGIFALILIISVFVFYLKASS